MKYLLLFLLPFSAYAGGNHHNETNIYETNIYNANGVALAMAKSSHQFDWGTHDLQGSIGYGSYGKDEALSFGLAQRVDDVLINATVGREDGSTGIGIGISWHF